MIRIFLVVQLNTLAWCLTCTNISSSASEDTQQNIGFGVSDTISVQLLTRPENGLLYLQNQITAQSRVQGDLIEVISLLPKRPFDRCFAIK